jgi:hypothetical protein
VAYMKLVWADIILHRDLTPRYRFASFESPGLDDEEMSAILEAMSLLPTGIVFAIVVDILVRRCETDELVP